MGLLPLFFLFEPNGGANVVSPNLVAQLQANNLQFTQVNTENCQFYRDTLFTWITGTVPGSQVNGFRPHPSPYVSPFRKAMSRSLYP